MLSSALFGRSRTPGLSTDDKTKLEEMTNLVDQATSDILNSVDWSANMQLVDQINCTSNPFMLREVVRHLRKRLQMKSSRVVMNSLTIAETLVMNCHTRFHQEIATDKFMEAVARVARTNCLAPHYDRNATEVAGKALELVQSWGEAFRGKHATLPLFLDTYVALKLEGMPFGDLDGEAPKPPVFTPRPSASVSPERPSGGPSISSSSSSAGPREAALSGSPPRPESLLGEARRAAAELRALVEALEVAPHRSGVKLGQGLDGVDAKEGALADRCRNLQTQLSLLVQRGVSEAHLEPMLATNDELLAALAKLDSVRLGGSSGRGSGGGSSTSSSRSSSSSRNSSSTSGGGSGGGGGTSSGIDLMGASAPEKPTEIPRLKPPRSDTPPRPRRAGSGAAAAAEDTPSQANRQSPPQPEPSPFLGLVMDPSPQPAAPSAWPSQGSSNSSLPFGAQGGAQGGARRSRGGASGFEEMGPSGSASGPPAAVPGSSDNPFEALVTEQSQNSKPASRDPFAGLVTDLK